MAADQIRQGDVLLVPVNTKSPANLAAQTEIILAEGELTGHAHKLRAKEVYEWEAGGKRYVRVHGNLPGELSHEDHDPTPAKVIDPEQTYMVIPQQEWDLKNQWRKVQD